MGKHFWLQLTIKQAIIVISQRLLCAQKMKKEDKVKQIMKLTWMILIIWPLYKCEFTVLSSNLRVSCRLVTLPKLCILLQEKENVQKSILQKYEVLGNKFAHSL